MAPSADPMAGAPVVVVIQAAAVAAVVEVVVVIDEASKVRSEIAGLKVKKQEVCDAATLPIKELIKAKTKELTKLQGAGILKRRNRNQQFVGKFESIARLAMEVNMGPDWIVFLRFSGHIYGFDLDVAYKGDYSQKIFSNDYRCSLRSGWDDDLGDMERRINEGLDKCRNVLLDFNTMNIDELENEYKRDED